MQNNQTDSTFRYYSNLINRPAGVGDSDPRLFFIRFAKTIDRKKSHCPGAFYPPAHRDAFVYV
jgi:hypothetical protein